MIKTNDLPLNLVTLLSRNWKLLEYEQLVVPISLATMTHTPHDNSTYHCVEHICVQSRLLGIGKLSSRLRNQLVGAPQGHTQKK